MKYQDLFAMLDNEYNIEFKIYNSIKELENQFPFEAVVCDEKIKHVTIKKKLGILSGLPVFIGEINNLTSLNIRGNNIREIPFFISELKNLMLLDMRNNKLSKIPSFIRKLKNLMALDIGYNKLSKIPFLLAN